MKVMQLVQIVDRNDDENECLGSNDTLVGLSSSSFKCQVENMCYSEPIWS